jgi:hypothetical protein
MQVKIRGESMQAAADAAESGMVSIIGLDSDKVQDICTAANEKLGSQAVQVANYLCSGNYVISGSKEVRSCDFVQSPIGPGIMRRCHVCVTDLHIVTRLKHSTQQRFMTDVALYDITLQGTPALYFL